MGDLERVRYIHFATPPLGKEPFLSVSMEDRAGIDCYV